MPTTTSELVALVNRHLPTDAKLSEDDGGYGWTDQYVEELLSTGLKPAQVVRFFWYQRTQETAEYLDLSKPLSQIHRQAKEMLAYWDTVIQTNPDGMEPLDPSANQNRHKNITFGSIERPWSK
ncbi:hypothetical protein PBI_ROPE_18 [Mycobacterium phage Rope]|uniref:Uncharacterized protein n=7 Tax=Papyrusvirus TaxID=1982554 RepID=A0A109ZR48_9CAUD|nr:hypothetical protein N842_gp018 [Mycobacterium phage Papyrus]YP_009614243.1 hypothetical protein FDI62_gp18 [Mycobacterium phage Send513]AMB17232.1 hypothetical protein SEA_WEISS13_18 [Mycobacterium phage Weiss13]ARW57104.1 hypothetical protein SEA_ZENON_19 [Mycobacterium phage Zenon]AYQ98592.1 hypothetical protein SEA_RIPARIAN_18 [Mycobacterium phage Riparian]QCG78125.1 hypothetical protein SEA_CANDLE_18 [Mycobacterium phage Candle]QNN99678.1 hypothetical protein PBI_ROPE_18 [Mycobacteriu